MIRLKYQFNDGKAVLISRNGRKFLTSIDVELKETSLNNQYLGETLSHDSLEHFENISNDNLQELSAIGSMYAHRDDALCNGFGEFVLYRLIAEQLVEIYSSEYIPEIKSNPVNSEINELVDDNWGKVVNYIKNEHELKISKKEFTNFKRLTKRQLSKGFNYVHSKIGSYNFALMFVELEQLINSIAKTLDYGLEHILNVQLNFKNRTISHTVHRTNEY